MSYASSHSGGIGCGELAAILGLDPYRSALDVWAQKRGLVEDRDETSAAIDRGVALESAVVDWFVRTHAAGPVLRQNQDGRTDGYDVPIRRGYLVGSPDAGSPVISGGKIVAWHFGVEAKTRQHDAGWGEPMTDEIPPTERAQVEGYLALTDAAAWFVPVLFGSPFEFRLYVVRRDSARSERLRAFVERWWQKHIVDGESPAVADTERSRLARLRHPSVAAPMLRSSAPEVLAVMRERREAEREYESAKAAFEAAERRRLAAGGAVEELLGDAVGIETPIGSATLRTRTSRGKLITKWSASHHE